MSKHKRIQSPCDSAIVPPFPQDDFGPFDFSFEIRCQFDFEAEFDFSREFSFVGDGALTRSWSFGSFKYDEFPFLTPMRMASSIVAITVAIAVVDGGPPHVSHQEYDELLLVPSISEAGTCKRLDLQAIFFR